jgi:uncharacterized membrane protein YeaQ/YmgE (transglycosylase-associated protein family)
MFFFILYGLIIGILAKAIHTGPDPIGFFPTLGIGIAGSYIGGLLNWILGRSEHVLSSSSLVMSVIGGVIFCYAYAKYKDYKAGQNGN